MTTRTLHLRREPLGSLSDDDLSAVVGRGDVCLPTCDRNCDDDLTHRLTCYCTLVC